MLASTRIVQWQNKKYIQFRFLSFQHCFFPETRETDTTSCDNIGFTNGMDSFKNVAYAFAICFHCFTIYFSHVFMKQFWLFPYTVYTIHPKKYFALFSGLFYCCLRTCHWCSRKYHIHYYINATFHCYTTNLNVFFLAFMKKTSRKAFNSTLWNSINLLSWFYCLRSLEIVDI